MDECKTKYPVMMIHGLGYDDKQKQYGFRTGGYWGHIPSILRQKGADVYFGCQDSNGEIKENAAQLYDTLLFICRDDNVDKVNLIAHSKGGIEARYMITHLDKGEHVASLTTIATPHHGIASSDKIGRRSKRLQKVFYHSIRTLISLDGGDWFDDYTVCDRLSADYMEVFNSLVPDMPDVYYQSYACDMKHLRKDAALALFYGIVRVLEGPNDGFVSIESAKWGDFKGVYAGERGKGISHSIATGGRPVSADLHRTGDISEFYVRIVSELKNMGF
ncbi:MAG: hypothetical protein II696_03865 [Firmicutes bacterium]|nr:hypothetical protein [Bacillota bacterium]